MEQFEVADMIYLYSDFLQMDPQSFSGIRKFQIPNGNISEDENLSHDGEGYLEFEDVLLEEASETFSDEQGIIDDNDTDIDEQWESEDNIPLARLQNKKITNKKQRKEEIIWLDDSLNVSQEDNAWTDFQSLPADICEMDQPYQFFSYFFTKDILSYITEQTNLFSVQVRPEKPANISEDEIKAFVGIFIYMSVIHLPSTRSYWNNTMEIPAVSQTMTCNRFEEIKRFLHFSDNNELVPFGQVGHDKLFKIRPFLDKVRERLFQKENEIKKRGRGSVVEKVAKVDDISVSVVVWYDNKLVTTVSTYVGHRLSLK
ncbi:hypothetical protein NQ314_017779 [Rhamnusium bicolor]|uniref:PiggyBac transposable element-derived protein domain-containing protein n=1 Tax=Rhamnusium bicolor TaxID=1586634 RepID=A0AAV8WSV2_9CUCU|nr:hypothetical protein NQ314_017779 [Rhamnusium bicolor]